MVSARSGVDFAQLNPAAANDASRQDDFQIVGGFNPIDNRLFGNDSAGVARDNLVTFTFKVAARLKPRLQRRPPRAVVDVVSDVIVRIPRWGRRDG